jgi:CBS domain-containing protein
MREERRTRVKDVMTARAVRIRKDSNIHRAAEIAALSRASDLMVVDDDDNFMGVLSEGDILRAAMPDVAEILREGGTLDVGYRSFMEKGANLSLLPIDSLVIREPIVLDPEHHVAQAAAILLDKSIRLLPVVSDGKLVGTVSRADVCRAIVGTL